MKTLSLALLKLSLRAFGLGVKMTLYEKIMASYPELTNDNFVKDLIVLRNDADGLGDYIEKWDYEQPIPNGLTLGKPTA